jgi:hypothetical protein
MGLKRTGGGVIRPPVLHAALKGTAVKLIDLTGQRFGRLRVVARASSKNKRTRWTVVCDCGRQKEVSAQNLTTPHASKRVVSCGCYHREVSYRPNAASRNPAYRMFWDAKKRAKAKGVPFSIAPADVTIPDICPLLGVPLKRGSGVLGPNSPSLDRIDASLGYVVGNVWVISHRANAIKSNATLAEFRRLLAAWEAKCAI